MVDCWQKKKKKKQYSNVETTTWISNKGNLLIFLI